MRQALALLLLALPLLAADQEEEQTRFLFRLSEDSPQAVLRQSNNLRAFQSLELRPRDGWLMARQSGNGLQTFLEAAAPELGHESDPRPDVAIIVRYAGSNDVDGLPLSTPQTLEALCQWDGGGDLEEGVTKRGRLSRIPWEYDQFGDFDSGLLDVDAYSFVPDSPAWCLELAVSNEVLLEARQPEGGSWHGALPLTEPEGGESPWRRLYITNALPGQRLTFRLSTPFAKDIGDVDYALLLRPVRPVILVHGIRSSPKDIYDRSSSFGDLKDGLKTLLPLYPALVLDFPWNSSRGEYTDYCGGPISLLNYARIYFGDWRLKPLIVSHSMGGILTTAQLQNREFQDLAGGLVFIGTPFFGSDYANDMQGLAQALNQTRTGRLLTRVSTANLSRLARGSRHVWERLEKLERIRRLLDSPRTVFLVGNGIRNSRCGLGDDVVNVSSADLPASLSLPAARVRYSGGEHSEMAEFQIPVPPEDPLFEELRRLLPPQ